MKKTYVIDRSTWVCGGYLYEDALGPSELLNFNGNMCCVGQICRQAGIPEKELLGKASPRLLRSGVKAPAELISSDPIVRNSDIAIKMMTIDADPALPQRDREKQLKEVAKELNWKLTFKGKFR